MKVLFFVRGRDEASVRFRVRQYLPYLRQREIVPDLVDLHVPWSERRALIRRAADYDVVVVHRALLGLLDVALLRGAARRWLFDFDDAIMMRDSAAAPRFHSWQRRLRFFRMVRNADHVIAGNTYLAEQARAVGCEVTVIPSVIDLAEYPQTADFAGPPVVGWIGTRVNLMYLQAIVPVLRRVAERVPAMQLMVVADGTIDVPGVNVVTKAWSAATEGADLTRFHVGLMPLADDPWTRGKCGLKLLQYMAAGVPAVCSPVGANTDIVSDGLNGYFARSEDEWVERICALVHDPAQSGALAAAGRRTVAERYSVTAQIERLMAVLAGVPPLKKGARGI